MPDSQKKTSAPLTKKGKLKQQKPGPGNGKRRDEERKPKLSRLHKPEGMALEDWQIELRRQFGREQPFALKNLGTEKIFSEFEVTNPISRNAYRVHIRGARPGDNFCSCPDFATNTLGTCKHIEFTLATLERKRGGVAVLRAGFQPPYSEVYLHYGAARGALSARHCLHARAGPPGGGLLRRRRGAAAGRLYPL